MFLAFIDLHFIIPRKKESKLGGYAVISERIFSHISQPTLAKNGRLAQRYIHKIKTLGTQDRVFCVVWNYPFLPQKVGLLLEKGKHSSGMSPQNHMCRALLGLEVKQNGSETHKTDASLARAWELIWKVNFSGWPANGPPPHAKRNTYIFLKRYYLTLCHASPHLFYLNHSTFNTVPKPW